MGWIHGMYILQSFPITFTFQQTQSLQLKSEKVAEKDSGILQFGKLYFYPYRKFNLRNWMPVLISCIVIAMALSCLWNLIYNLGKNQVPVLSVSECLSYWIKNESSNLNIVHPDLQEILAYLVWFNQTTESSATICYTYMACKNMVYWILNLLTYCDCAH